MTGVPNTAAAFATAAAALADPVKKERKARAPKAEVPATVEVEAVPAAAAVSADLLGLNAAPVPTPPAAPAEKEMTEKESSDQIFKITEKFLVLTAKDNPSGQSILVERMQNHYKVGKLQDLVHAQRVEWIKWVGKMIVEHK